MLDEWFLEHPRTVGETYFQHQRIAVRFAVALFRAAILCLIHALVPKMFDHSASLAVAELHQRMTRRNGAQIYPQEMGRGLRQGG